MNQQQILSDLADTIIHDCEEDDFESFKDMCQSNWWDSTDIKEYVSDVMTLVYGDGSAVYIDEIDGDVIIESESNIIPFRNFMIALRRELKSKGY